jgi:hypothetical protein
MRKFITLFFLFSSLILFGEDEKDLILLDSMESKGGWDVSMEEGADCYIKLDEGRIGKSLVLVYDLKDKNWVQVYKSFKVDFSKLDSLYMDLKTEGAVNNIEIKIIDKDGSNFGKRLLNFTTGNNWQRLKISKDEFEYFWGGDQTMDWKNVESLWIAVSRSEGGKGKLYIDNIEYKKKEEELLKLEGLATKLVVDNFERSDPYKVYIPILNDNSELDLKSSFSYVIDGNYSMEMYYKLSTEKSVPSSVSALYKFETGLNWNRVSTVNIWVKGDSSKNIFSVEIIDGSEELWVYDDYKVLQDNQWHLITIPVNKFKLSDKGVINNKIFERERILGIRLTIKGWKTEESAGKIYVDKLYVEGVDLIPENIIPEEVRAPIILERPQGNVDLKGQGVVEYKWNPEEGYNLFGYGKLKFDAKVKKFSAYIELTTENLEFGKTVFIEKSGASSLTLKEDKPAVEVTSIQFNIREPFPYMNEILIGNLFEDFSDYTYSIYHTGSAAWGYKGIKTFGSISYFNYRVMFLKQIFDSYLLATEFRAYLPYIDIRGIYIFNNDRGHIPNTGKITENDINANEQGNFKSRQVMKEKTYSIEISKNLLEQKLYFNFIWAENYYKKLGVAELVTEGDKIVDYVYNYSLDVPLVKVGQLYKFELQTRSLLWHYFDLYLSLRDADKDYKPEYRNSPYWFDEIYTGGYGGNFRFYQGLSGWAVSGEMDILYRKISKKYYRKFYRYGINKYAFYNFEFGLFNEIKFQDDKYYETINDNLVIKKEKIISYIFQIIFTPFPRFRIFEEQRLDKITHTETGKKFESLRFYGLIEYFITSNAKLNIEGCWLKYGHRDWEPQTYPYSDNFYKVYLEINF